MRGIKVLLGGGGVGGTHQLRKGCTSSDFITSPSKLSLVTVFQEYFSQR